MRLGDLSRLGGMGLEAEEQDRMWAREEIVLEMQIGSQRLFCYRKESSV